MSKVSAMNYSEKAFAIHGETKTIKDQLMELDGRFNPHLTRANGEKFVGWIFSKKNKEKVFNILGIKRMGRR